MKQSYASSMLSISWSPWTNQTEKPALQLTNAGLTTAMNVTLVVTVPTMQQALHVGTVEPGETRTLDIEYPKLGLTHDHIELICDPLWRVHWSSPLGHPGEIKATARKPNWAALGLGQHGPPQLGRRDT